MNYILGLFIILLFSANSFSKNLKPNYPYKYIPMDKLKIPGAKTHRVELPWSDKQIFYEFDGKKCKQRLQGKEEIKATYLKGMFTLEVWRNISSDLRSDSSNLSKISEMLKSWDVQRQQILSNAKNKTIKLSTKINDFRKKYPAGDAMGVKYLKFVAKRFEISSWQLKMEQHNNKKLMNQLYSILETSNNQRIEIPITKLQFQNKFLQIKNRLNLNDQLYNKFYLAFTDKEKNDHNIHTIIAQIILELKRLYQIQDGVQQIYTSMSKCHFGDSEQRRQFALNHKRRGTTFVKEKENKSIRFNPQKNLKSNWKDSLF